MSDISVGGPSPKSWLRLTTTFTDLRRLLDRTGRVACFALLAATLMPSASSAGFKTLRTLGTKASSSDRPDLAIDATGDGLFVWTSPEGRIQSRARSAAGKLGRTLTLSVAGKSANFARVGMAANGNALVVWEQGIESNAIVQARTVSAAGALGPIMTLSAAGQEAHAPAVAVNPDGKAVATWAALRGASFRVEARTVSAAGKLGPTAILSRAGLTAFFPALALDGQGNAFVAWENSDGSNNRIEARTFFASGTLGPLKTLSAAGQTAASPEVAVTTAGNAVAVWQRSDGTNVRAQARTFSQTGALGRVLKLSASGDNVASVHVGSDGNGDSLMTWALFDGANWRIQARALSPTGVLDRTHTLSDAGEDAVDPAVAVEPNGIAWFAWNRSDGTTSRIQVRGRSADGNLRRTQTLSTGPDNGYHARVVANGAGNVLVSWELVTSGDGLVQAAAGP